MTTDTVSRAYTALACAFRLVSTSPYRISRSGVPLSQLCVHHSLRPTLPHPHCRTSDSGCASGIKGTCPEERTQIAAEMERFDQNGDARLDRTELGAFVRECLRRFATQPCTHAEAQRGCRGGGKVAGSRERGPLAAEERAAATTARS
jgi:hypothetical protein